MSKRHRHTYKLPPFVPLFNSTRATPAWKALSYGARCTYVELKGFYNHKLQNLVYLSCRKGADALGTRNATRVGEWLQELEFHGFIIQETGGALGSDGEGFSPHYRLTEVGYKGQSPTRDFMQWDGVKFKKPKRKTESRNQNGYGVSPKGLHRRAA